MAFYFWQFFNISCLTIFSVLIFALVLTTYLRFDSEKTCTNDPTIVEGIFENELENVNSIRYNGKIGKIIDDSLIGTGLGNCKTKCAKAFCRGPFFKSSENVDCQKDGTTISESCLSYEYCFNECDSFCPNLNSFNPTCFLELNSICK